MPRLRIGWAGGAAGQVRGGEEAAHREKGEGATALLEGWMAGNLYLDSQRHRLCDRGVHHCEVGENVQRRG